MSKIRVLSDQLANQIAAGEVVERPASVAKELVENAIDSGARRIEIDVEGGGRRLLRVADDGEGMSRDDAVLAFERHATSKISDASDLNAIGTLGFRGEALASIAAVARVELLTKTDVASSATRVVIEGGRMRDVKDAAHPNGTTVTVRDLFFNVPARRKFLRSEATESFHLTNLVTHYALANHEIAFRLTNNGRETLRVAPARDLRERVYQVFGAEFLANLLEVNGSLTQVGRASGFVSAPRERRTSRDAQYLFINGRYVRDRLVSRALSDAYRTVLPNGLFPAALLFLDVPLEEVDVNVHPAKIEVRFRRAAAVADTVREAVRNALTAAGYVRPSSKTDIESQPGTSREGIDPIAALKSNAAHASNDSTIANTLGAAASGSSFPPVISDLVSRARESESQEKIEFRDYEHINNEREKARDAHGFDHSSVSKKQSETEDERDSSSLSSVDGVADSGRSNVVSLYQPPVRQELQGAMPPVHTATNLVREVPVESLSRNVRVLGQLDDSYIVASDDEGLLLISQHVAHERILFDKYRRLEGARTADSQNLLIPETFDLTPTQAIALDQIEVELDAYGFALMRLSGRTLAIKAVPADLPIGEARNLLAEILGMINAERRGVARDAVREGIAASLACHAAVRAGTSLAPEKMRWLIDELLRTTSPTTCPHGRAVVLRLSSRDIEKAFQKT